MKRTPQPSSVCAAIFCLPLLLTPLLGSGLKIKKIKATANPPEYVKFSRPLRGEDQFQHASERLTFGPRPGDLEQLRESGLRKWLDAQLHPERIPEDPALKQRLTELSSLGMSIHDTYVHYPSRQRIAAFARGRGNSPDDPELRAIVVHLADGYWEKQDANGDSDLALKVKLSSILTAQQIQLLHAGNPDEKGHVLASIPADRRADFVWALRPGERRQLFTVAPVDLRRQLTLSISPQAVVASDLSEGKLLRAIYSNHQLAELLTDFWFNHFNVFLNKGSDRYTVPTYEREAIRPHVFGKFYDLLLATAKSPAMLFYLDNWQSSAPQTKANSPLQSVPQTTRKRARGLNENYGRELLELHTLGVDGGYTQKDVIEVARCFTGWTIANPRRGGGFEYNDKMHDKGRKVVLGHAIPPGGGMNDGLEVLDILAHRPATAHFISLKLAQRFVSDDPPPSLVDRMTKNFLRSGGDLRQVTETMIMSPEFWSEGAYHAKVKTPFEMVVSAVRATNADVTSAFLLANELQKLGEPLYRKIEPTGYSSANTEWVSSAALLERINFALALAHNRIAGVRVEAGPWQAEFQQDPMAVARSFLAHDPSAQTRAAIETALSSEESLRQLAGGTRTGPERLPALVAALALGSPEFQRH